MLLGLRAVAKDVVGTEATHYRLGVGEGAELGRMSVTAFKTSLSRKRQGVGIVTGVSSRVTEVSSFFFRTRKTST